MLIVITQDGRKLEAEEIVFYDDGRTQLFFAGDTWDLNNFLGNYGYWLVAEFVANDFWNALESGKKEFKMPPYMSTAKEYHEYKAVEREKELAQIEVVA